jgi:hypothetical protein
MKEETNRSIVLTERNSGQSSSPNQVLVTEGFFSETSLPLLQRKVISSYRIMQTSPTDPHELPRCAAQ